MVTTALVFDHRGRAGTSQEGPIEVRITYNRTVRYVSTGVRVLKKHWQGGVVIDRYDCDELNDRLRIIMKKVATIINQLIDDGKGIDIDYIRKNMVNSTTANPDSFLRWLDEQIPLLDITDGTRRAYDTLKNRLEEFGEIRCWQDITVDNIYKFNAWLKSKTLPRTEQQIRNNMPASPIKDVTIKNYHKKFKAILMRAYKAGMISSIDDIPYTRLKGEFSTKFKNKNIEYLTDEEMKKIVKFRPAPGTELCTARDLFVVQMYTGLAYADAESMDLSQYKKVNGRWVYNGQRIKTGVGYVSDLLPPVVEVLERYGWQVPQMSNQHYNQSLKVIGRMLGIKSHMHSHLARHTFATYMLRNGVDITNLQRMMGHSRIEQTMRYANVLAESVHEDFEMIAEKMNKK